MTFYDSRKGKLDAKLTAPYLIEMIEKHIESYDSSALSMGWGNGEIARYFNERFKEFTVIEGDMNLSLEATKYCVNACWCLFEQFKPIERYDYILATNVLEHVWNPTEVLRKIKEWKRPEGKVVIIVPNATSLHRRVGIKMGLIGSPYYLSQRDRDVGHKRVYTLRVLKEQVKEAGFTILWEDGYGLKLVPQKYMGAWPKKMQDAIFELSKEMDYCYCSDLCVVCK